MYYKSSFVRIKFHPAVHQPRMRKMSDFRSVHLVAELVVRKILISSANKKYQEYLIELQSSLINTLHNMGQRTDPSKTPESTSKGVEKCYGF